MEEKDVICGIRSCIMSEKDGIPFTAINRDYQSQFGSQIPYRKFGYDSLEKFLKSIPSIIFAIRGGEAILRVVADQKTAHISSLIARQKVKKKKKSRPSFAPTRTTYPSKPKRFFGSCYMDQYKKASPAPFVYSPPKPKTVKPTGVDYMSAPQGSTGAADLRVMLNQKPKKSLPQTSSSVAEPRVDVRGYPLVTVKNEDAAQPSKPDEVLRVTLNNNSRHVRLPVGKENRTSVTVRREEPTKTNDVLCVTVKNNYRQIRMSGEQDDEPSHIGFKIRELSKLIYNTTYFELSEYPLVKGHTLLGDDFFVGLVTEQLAAPFTVHQKRLTSWLCRNGASIAELTKELQTNRFSDLPKKAVVLIGAIDIINEKEFSDIAKDLFDLVGHLLLVAEHITICTIPPLLGWNVPDIAHENLFLINELIRTIPEDFDQRINILDLHAAFTRYDPQKAIQFFRVQTDQIPVVWNRKGFRFVLDLLTDAL